MRVATIANEKIELDQASLEGLKLQLQGKLLVEGEEGYENSRTLWNGMIDRKPAFIVQCLGTADVISSVTFARKHNILLCIKGGGHNIAGLAAANDAMMLDMSMMRGVWVDSKKKIARAQAGCLLGDVDRQTQLHGLAAVLGFVSLTGITGLTTGGGFGYLTRRWGWASDNIAGFEMVTSAGELVRADKEENEELFWGLRGGGGNFGVVTGIDYMLHPVGPEVVGGLVAWPAGEAPGVLGLYRELITKAPRELTLVALMRNAPPAPWLPDDMHGQPIVALLACYSGDPVEGEKAVAPIKSYGKPIGDILVRRPYVQLQSLLDATQPKGRRYYWKSEYLSGIGTPLCDSFIKHAARIVSPHSAVILFQLEGALNEVDENHSAAGNRDAKYVFNIAASWDSIEDDGANMKWAKEAWEDMRSFSTGGTYINFLTEDEGPERLKAALRSGLGRLAEVKAKWDPENFFRINRNIKPVL